MLPRYTFMQGEPCAGHGSYDCLCDVNLDGRGETPVLKDAHHLFHQTALNELGDDTVSARNIVEFISIVLGQHLLHEEMVDSMPDGYDQNEQTWVPTLYMSELRSDKWDCVPPEVAASFQAHWKVGTPWSIARLELPLDLPADKVDMLYQVYRANRNKEAWNRRHKGGHAPRKMFEQPAICETCGAGFTARRVSNGANWSVTCSTDCRLARDRKVRAERKRNARKATKVSA